MPAGPARAAPRRAPASGGVAVPFLATALLLSAHPATALVSGGADAVLPGEFTVRATVTDVESRWVPGRQASIETSAWIEVEAALSGRAPARTLELVVPGGTVGDVRLVVEDVPNLAVGQSGTFRVQPRAAGDFSLVSVEGLAPTDPPLHPYVLEGPSWAYQPAPVEDAMRLVSNFPGSFGPMDEVEDAFVSAQETWNTEGDAAVALDYHGRVGSGSAEGEGVLYVLYAQGQSGGGATLAVTQYWMDGSGDRMTDCDILVYPSNGYGTIDWSTDPSGPGPSENDFESVIVHELGHCLGLGHSASSGAVMAPSITQGTTKRSLAQDDRNGLQALYGPDCPDEDRDGWSSDGGCSGETEDCDDGDEDVHPGAEESCDGVDEDCSGEPDDGFPSNEEACSDGEDNDCDGDADQDDPDCAGAGDDDDGDDDGGADDDDGDADGEGDDESWGQVPCGACDSGTGTGHGRALAVAALSLLRARRRRADYIPSHLGGVPAGAAPPPGENR